VAKHRRAATAAPDVPPPQPGREILVWTAFGCALVPLALLWSGAGWAVALGVGGLIVLLAAGCALALRLSGMTFGAIPPQSNASQRDDERPAEP
jgi:uncharacterized protein (DUF58 family)